LLAMAVVLVGCCGAGSKLADSGNHGRGTAVFEGGVFVLTGTAIGRERVFDFQQTSKIVADGTLQDRCYNGGGAEWIAGHVIEHVAVKSGPPANAAGGCRPTLTRGTVEPGLTIVDATSAVNGVQHLVPTREGVPVGVGHRLRLHPYRSASRVPQAAQERRASVSSPSTAPDRRFSLQAWEPTRLRCPRP